MPRNETSSLSNLVAQHRKSLRRLKNLSIVFRSRYRVLSYHRKRTRLAFGGMTGLAFRFRMEPTNASESYALSATTTFARSPKSNASACVTSASLPGVNRTRMGRPLWSTAAWTFVVGPPRLRPMDCGPFFFLCAMCGTVAANERAVQAHSCETWLGGEHIKNALPNAAATPVHVTDVYRMPVTIAGGQVAPRQPDTKPVQDRVDETPGISGMSFFPLSTWAKRFDPFPLFIRQVETSHRLVPLPRSDKNSTKIFKGLTTYYLNRP